VGEAERRRTADGGFITASRPRRVLHAAAKGALFVALVAGGLVLLELAAHAQGFGGTRDVKPEGRHRIVCSGDSFTLG
jgi:hypothetical protein